MPGIQFNVLQFHINNTSNRSCIDFMIKSKWGRWEKPIIPVYRWRLCPKSVKFCNIFALVEPWHKDLKNKYIIGAE